MTDKTPASQTEAIQFVFDLGHPPEKVWRALTEPALLSEWLLPITTFPLQPGAAFRFQAPAQPGWDGRVEGRMIEVDPMHHITYAWVVGELHTVVRFTLTPTPAGTHLELVQSGFRADQKQNFGGARYGWRMMGERLVALLGRVA